MQIKSCGDYIEFTWALDDPDYHNETEFSTAVGIIVAQLEIYDQVWVVRDAA